MQKTLDLVMKSVAVVFFVFFLVGGIVVFRYCIGIGYLPAGINIGDSLFFLSVAISFAIVFLVYLVLIFSISLFFVWLIRVPLNWILSLAKFISNSNEYQIGRINASIELLFLCGFITAIIAIGLVFIELNDYVISTLTIIGSVSFAIGLCLIESKDREPLKDTIAWDFQSREGRRRISLTGSLLVFMAIILLVPSERFFQLSRLALIQIGVSKRHADVYLDSKIGAEFNGVGTVNDDYTILKDVEILWTGLGSRSVIMVEVNGEPRKIVVNTNDMLFSYK